MNDELTERSKAQGDRLREKEQEIRERAAKMRALDARLREQQALLGRMLHSRAVLMIEGLARLRPGREPAISRAQIKRVLYPDQNDRPDS